MKLIDGACGCCGKQQKFEIADFKISESNLLRLQDYYDFKYVGYNICERCGYVSTHITDEVRENIKNLVSSDGYKRVLNDGFMEGFKDLDFQDYEKFQCGELDALALLFEKTGKYNFEYAKVVSRIYEVKKSIRGVYIENMADMDDEDYDEVCDKLIKRLSEEISNSAMKCMQILSEIEINHPFEAIFVAECCTRVNKYNFAKELIDQVKYNFELDPELQRYVEEFMTKVERI